MKIPNTKEEVIAYLLKQNPQLIVEQTFSGYILEIENDIVHARIINDKAEEYDCELSKNIFPQEDLAENIGFLMILGNVNNKKFTHVNYFYWTTEHLEMSKKKAQLLYDLLDLPENQN